MAMDNLSLKIILKSLKNELEGAFLDKPFNLTPTHFAFPFHSSKNPQNKGRGTLIIAMDPNNPFICYSFDKFTKVNLNSPFINSLKKLIGTKIISVDKQEGERIITISFQIINQTIETINTGYKLIIELFPQKPNIYLIPLPYNKVSSLYKENSDVFSKRYINRGTSYVFPPLRKEISLDCQNLEQAKLLLSRSTYKLFEKYVENKDFSTSINDLLNSQNLYYINKNIEPFNFGLDLKPIEVEDIYKTFISNQEKIAKEYAHLELTNHLKKLLALEKKKKEHILMDIDNAKSKLNYVQYGQELFLHQLEIKKGQTFCDFDNFHILLDPKLTAVENANRYFKLYHKSKAAIEILKPLVDKTTNSIDYLEEKLIQIDKGGNQDILELTHELYLEGYLKNTKNNKIRISKVSKVTPHYLVSNNYKIGFGLNALQNEELTFNIAKKDDIFLHVLNYPGSHVVILEGDSNSTRLLASELALYLSNLTSGDVQYTEKKNVKKNKEKRGLVNLLSYKLITIKEIRPSSIELFKTALKEH